MINIESKMSDEFPRESLTGFPVTPDQSRCMYESIPSCPSERKPPIRSRIIWWIDQPWVDLLL